jgi:hypothetical protein
MIDNLTKILTDNLNFLLKTLGFFIILYCFFYFTQPKTSLSIEDRIKLDSINEQIKILSDNQKKFNESVKNFENEIHVLSDSLTKIKNEKIIIRKIYYEEINRVTNFNDKQIDSFFSNKYGFTPR